MNPNPEIFSWDIYDKMPGFLTENEAKSLITLCQNKNVIEIGTNTLKSSYIFAHHAQFVYTIDLSEDPHSTNLDEIIKNLPNEHMYRILERSSDDAFEILNDSKLTLFKKADLIFFNGDYSYHQLCRDLRNYMQLLAPDGYLVIPLAEPYHHPDSAFISITIQQAILTTFDIMPDEIEKMDSMWMIKTPKLRNIPTFQLPMAPRQPRILLIGDMSNPVADYYEILVKMGYFVFWAGDNAVHLNTINFKSSVELNPFSMPYAGEAVVKVKRYPIAHLLDQIGHDFDLILHFQGWFQPTDLKCEIPYIYYCSEGWWPEIPICATYVIVPNAQTKGLVMQANPHRFESTIFVIPFSIGALFNNRKILTNRSTKMSWAGDIYRFSLLYKERREILYKMIGNNVDFHGFDANWADGKTWNADHRHWKQGAGFLNAEQYTTLLDNSQFGLNIPTRLGSNFRDLEVPACGAILVTKATPDILELGFKDGVNCYFYKTYEDLIEIMKKPFDISIALMGYTLVNMKHRHIHRIPLFEQIFSLCSVTPLGLITKMYRYNEFHQPEFLLEGPLG